MYDGVGERFLDAERQLQDAVANRHEWRSGGTERLEIRADFLRSLILGQLEGSGHEEAADILPPADTSTPLDVMIDGDGLVDIVGNLDLKQQRIARKISLSGVRLLGDLHLDHAIGRDFRLRAARIEGMLSARGAEIRGSFFLEDSEIEKEIDLSGAKIWGDLTAKGLRKLNRDRTPGTGTLDVRALTVEGQLDICGLEGFHRIDMSDLRAKRLVRFQEFDLPDCLLLDNAKIGGSLEFVGMHFGLPEETGARRSCDGKDGFVVPKAPGKLDGYEYRKDTVISVGGTDVLGSVVFGEFNEESRVYVYSGGVRFTSAKIIGDLDLRGLSIFGCDSVGISLDVRGSKIGASARLDLKRPAKDFAFEATCGSVLFHTTQFGGSLELTDAFVGGFNDEYFNSLAIYACRIGAKLEIGKLRCRDRSERRQISTSGRIRRARPPEPSAARCAAGRLVTTKTSGAVLGPPINFSSPQKVSPKISIIQTEAKILEIGRPAKCRQRKQKHWTLFDIEKRQLTLRGLTYERLEESTSRPEDWIKLLANNTPFSDRAERQSNENQDAPYTYERTEREKQNHWFDADVWSQAARVLEREGHSSAARKIRHQRDTNYLCSLIKDLPKSRLDIGRIFEIIFEIIWNAMLWLFIGFGFKAHNPFIIGLAAIAFGGFYFENAYRDCLIAPAQEEIMVNNEYETEGKRPISYPRFDAFIYSIDLFLPMMETGQTEYWRPARRIQNKAEESPKMPWGIIEQITEWFGRGLRALGLLSEVTTEWANVLLRALGWITISFGVIALTPLVKRD